MDGWEERVGCDAMIIGLFKKEGKKDGVNC
jgi:hypothetical protein